MASAPIVAITGSHGLIGSALVGALASKGARVRRVVRGAPQSADDISWDPQSGRIDAAAFESVDAVVNLAGEPLDQRWTRESKTKIRESRVRGTELLARTLAASGKTTTLLSGSAIGIYGDRGDEALDERSSAGNDFLAGVCQSWEAATRPAEDAGVRVVHLRTGIVLDRDRGALARMLTPFRLGVGGRLGSGRQWMSWIALADIVSALTFLLERPDVRGALNLVAPSPVRNAELTRALANELHRPAMFPVPRLALSLLLGEMADGAVLASQRVMPKRLVDEGFRFAYPTIEQALAAILSP